MILFAFKHMQQGGGAEKNLIEVAQHVARSHRVGFLIAGGDVDPRMTAAGPVFTMPGMGRAWLMPLDLLHLAWLKWRHGVTVVHAHHRYPAFLAALLRPVTGLRLVTTVHNRFPNRAGLSLWGDRAIAVSHDIAQWLRDECGTPERLVRVIHNGVQDPAPIAPAERAACRAEFAVPEGARLLCAVGRLTEQKNFGLLFEALGALKRPDWVLALVGEGEQREALQRQAEALGIAPQLRFLGFRRDVARIMQSSDALVMSSAWEGFPYVVIEALANRLPIVATDVGGVREGVLHEQTGLLVPPGDAAALTAALRRVLDDAPLRAAMAGHARAHFEAHFDAATMLDAVQTEIESLLPR